MVLVLRSYVLNGCGLFFFYTSKNRIFLQEPVRLVWMRSKKGTRYNRCAISIHPFGLSIYEEIANGTYKNIWSDAIDDISYCVAEPLYRRIFAWIARSPRTNELECHVLLCKTSKRARHLAELLAKAFQDSYHYRQQQQRLMETSSISMRCSACETMARANSTDNVRLRSPLFRSHSHDVHFQDGFDMNRSMISNSSPPPPPLTTAMHSDYDRNVARAFVRSYASANSINSNSRRSIDNDTTLADEESIKPVEYYRG